MLQRDINIINNWVKDNSLTFNVSKCKYILISCKRQGGCDPPDLLLGDLILERVESFQILRGYSHLRLVVVESCRIYLHQVTKTTGTSLL